MRVAREYTRNKVNTDLYPEGLSVIPDDFKPTLDRNASFLILIIKK